MNDLCRVKKQKLHSLNETSTQATAPAAHTHLEQFHGHLQGLDFFVLFFEIQLEIVSQVFLRLFFQLQLLRGFGEASQELLLIRRQRHFLQSRAVVEHRPLRLAEVVKQLLARQFLQVRQLRLLGIGDRTQKQRAGPAVAAAAVAVVVATHFGGTRRGCLNDGRSSGDVAANGTDGGATGARDVGGGRHGRGKGGVVVAGEEDAVRGNVGAEKTAFHRRREPHGGVGIVQGRRGSGAIAIGDRIVCTWKGRMGKEGEKDVSIIAKFF